MAWISKQVWCKLSRVTYHLYSIWEVFWKYIFNILKAPLLLGVVIPSWRMLLLRRVRRYRVKRKANQKSSIKKVWPPFSVMGRIRTETWGNVSPQFAHSNNCKSAIIVFTNMRPRWKWECKNTSVILCIYMSLVHL